ncbi:hypothetical protein [Alkalihalobacillus pseudalcaliphilus]|uniref:hypothetical protein n=1 Tax=Alkalihalobacillus pseudalcaliphilus TaxID=79884 RepID=UPI00064D9CE7|nr:hypothetical protein [Alkalihalobacillus pseudalcaliphilus]KMK74429.1 hypothetical protein AB990_21210 [Alkalihalobacillus pseudalcaliphilus]
MKNYNEKMVNLSKEISKDNVGKSWETAKKLTRPSKATRIGSVIGTSIGTGILCVGLIGVTLGKGVLGASGLVAGLIMLVTNVKNYKNSKLLK